MHIITMFPNKTVHLIRHMRHGPSINKLVILAAILSAAVVFILTTQNFVKADNKSSYDLGYSQGNISNFDPSDSCNKHLNKYSTNETACENGFFVGWKDYCLRNAKDCVQDFILGGFPDMAFKAHQQFLAGQNAANDSGTAMCPIGENAAFCNGWDSNNNDYGNGDCADTPLANISQFLVGCPEDIMTNSQIGGIPALVGKWNFVNQTGYEVSRNLPGIEGTMLFNNNGYYLMTVPNKTPFGNYTLEAGWGTLGHNILTICNAENCENNTLITVSSDYIKFKDNENNTIQLTRIPIPISVTAPIRIVGPVAPIPLNGTWNLTSNGAVNKTLGQITFPPNSDRFTGTFNANREPVQGTYSFKGHKSLGDLSLSYTYHDHPVQIVSKLNMTDHDDMKMFYINVYNPIITLVPTIGSDYKVTTGLYLRPGYIISLARAPPIGFINSLMGNWTFYNETSPTVTAASHGFTAKQRNTTDIFSSNSDISPNIKAAIKTNSDKEKWSDYILSLAMLKTGHIKFDTSTFMVTPTNNNGLCITDGYALSCGPGEWSTDGQTLKLTYYAGSSKTDQGPAGAPLQLPPRTFLDTILTFKSITPERIIATDIHNDTIYFLKDHLAKTIVPVNLIGTWRFSTDIVDGGTGPPLSGKFVFERGTYNFPTTNANFTEILANGATYRGNWDMGNYILSLYYFGSGTEVWLLKVINPNTVELSGNSGNVVHMTRIPAGSG
jgi:hypothetical protein